METLWFIVLLSAICLEGLGRKYLPFIPAPVFYFFKDVVLLFGWLRFRPSTATTRMVKYLYRGFGVIWGCAMVWTLIEVFNPEHQSLMLGAIGLRSYWVWWLAPPVIATVLESRRQRGRAIYALVIMALAVSALAAVQFASPADASVNLYVVQDGQEVYAANMATVAATGRARVSSTFTFLSGFVDFTIAVPTILLSVGLDSENRMVRRAALVATLATAAVVPMSGSRGAVVLGVAVLVIAMWSAGLVFSRVGRRILVGSGVAAVLSVVAFPEAFLGVQSRFENRDETAGRIEEVANVLPPLAMVVFDYPMLGIGTGMQQNARASFRIGSQWDTESELGKYLVELGPIGFSLFWTAKLGLVVALLRAHRILKRAGRRGSAGAALSYSALTMFGNITFDHNWQALYFVGCGFVLTEVIAVRRQHVTAQAAAAAAANPTEPATVVIPARPAASGA